MHEHQFRLYSELIFSDILTFAVVVILPFGDSRVVLKISKLSYKLHDS